MIQAVPLWKVALLGRCPRCGDGKIFSSFLGVAKACQHCHLAVGVREQGDGPAFFAITLVGAVVAIGAVILELSYSPPFWLHALIWLPFTCIGSVLALRLFKGAMIGIQYTLRRGDFGA